MLLHFAYGTNMSRALMRAKCPNAEPVGPARLDGWRFVVNAEGYPSILPVRGGVVYGVLWRLSLRDRAVLDSYEGLESGLYHRRTLTILWNKRRALAMAYVAHAKRTGRPKPGYQESIVAAARDWELPQGYLVQLSRWLPSGLSAARGREAGELLVGGAG